jgi:hypothetical protein
MQGISAQIIYGPVKQVTRAISKTVRAYRGNFRRLTDVVRTTIVFQSFSDIQKFLEALRSKSCMCPEDDKDLSNKIMDILLVRNRFDAKLKCGNQLYGGYRDILLKIRMGFACVRTASAADCVKFLPKNRWRQDAKTLVFEIQLHHKELQLGDNDSDKEKYHDKYVKSRDYMSI